MGPTFRPPLSACRAKAMKVIFFTQFIKVFAQSAYSPLFQVSNLAMVFMWSCSFFSTISVATRDLHHPPAVWCLVVCVHALFPSYWLLPPMSTTTAHTACEVHVIFCWMWLMSRWCIACLERSSTGDLAGPGIPQKKLPPLADIEVEAHLTCVILVASAFPGITWSTPTQFYPDRIWLSEVFLMRDFAYLSPWSGTFFFVNFCSKNFQLRKIRSQ